jgi:hypothetical protein
LAKSDGSEVSRGGSGTAARLGRAQESPVGAGLVAASGGVAAGGWDPLDCVADDPGEVIDVVVAGMPYRVDAAGAAADAHPPASTAAAKVAAVRPTRARVRHEVRVTS